MAQGDVLVQLDGNLVDDPQLRYTPTGTPVCNFRVASTNRRLNKATNEWEDGDTVFLTCNVWRAAAENVAESLQRGMAVVVAGKLRQRSYETKEGEKRTVFEVEVDNVGPSLQRASAKVTKAGRSGGTRPVGGNGGGGGFGGGQPAGDPWAAGPATASAPGGSPSQFDAEPPF